MALRRALMSGLAAEPSSLPNSGRVASCNAADKASWTGASAVSTLGESTARAPFEAIVADTKSTTSLSFTCTVAKSRAACQ